MESNRKIEAWAKERKILNVILGNLNYLNLLVRVERKLYFSETKFQVAYRLE